MKIRGRWAGRLTSRPLPEHDAELERLSDAQRRELVDVWLGRAASERRVSDAFVVIRHALLELRSPAALVELATRAVDDELRHAELSRLVASRCAGRELDAPAPLQLIVPEHPGAPPELVNTLHVLGHCVLNETFASAFLEASLSRTRTPLARAALRELLSDEIDHARIGWAHLAQLPAAARRELAPWLPSLLEANLAMWRTTPRPYPVDPALHRHGAPPAELVEEALHGAVERLVLPGLELLGVPTSGLGMSCSEP